MSRRSTIVIDDDIDKKCRTMQANLIKTRQRSVSFSSVVNEMLGRAFKNG